MAAADPRPSPNAEKEPGDWVTGDEPMTGPQRSYLETLSREAGEEVDPHLTKVDASRRIEELQQRTGRGGTDRPAGRTDRPGTDETTEDRRGTR